jgi:hypothetical protein
MLLEVFGTEEALDRMASVHPIGRIGRPEEIAELLVEVRNSAGPLEYNGKVVRMALQGLTDPVRPLSY